MYGFPKQCIERSQVPMQKIKQCRVARALTTPGKKNREKPNSTAFRSVRNPKAKAAAVPKNRIVAKALVFHSPKKSEKADVALERNTPVNASCAGMKKLEISGGKRPVLGYNRPVPLDASRKQLKVREVKSRVYNFVKVAKDRYPSLQKF